MRLVPAVLSALLSTTALAASGGQPLTTTHNGYLLNQTDQPLEETALSMTFRIYDRSASVTGQTLEWDATCPVAVKNGFYSVVLGEGDCAGVQPLDTADVPGSAARWLEVAIGAVTLAPRMAITAVPIASTATTALNANLLESHPANYFATADHGHPAASSTTTGLLLASDWSTFNGKLATEADPEVGTLANGKWCTSNGATVSCTAEPPTGGTVTAITAGSGLTNKTITTSGTLDIASDGVTSAMLASEAASLAKVSGGALNASGGSGGSVGLGTASPTARLHATAGGTYTPTGEVASFVAGNSWSNANGVVSIVNPSALQNATDRQLYVLSGATSGKLAEFVGSGSSSVMTIGASGNVGLGTDSPGARLQVGEDTGAHVKYLDYGSLQLLKLDLNDTSPAMKIQNTAGTQFFRVQHDGKVGIGTTPGSSLHVFGSSSLTDVRVGDGVDRVLLRQRGSGNFVVDRSGNDDLVVNASGSVGIGTTTPTAKVDVRGGRVESDYFYNVLYTGISTSSTQTVVDRNGNQPPVNFVAQVSCTVLGTSYSGTSTWFVKHHDSGGYYIERVASFGSTSSNTPELFIFAGTLKVRLYDHPSPYDVNCLTMRVQ